MTVNSAHLLKYKQINCHQPAAFSKQYPNPTSKNASLYHCLPTELVGADEQVWGLSCCSALALYGET